MSMITQKSLLIQKLDAFIRKYYLNKLIRGGLLFLGLVLVFFLVFATLEHFGHFGTAGRTFFFYAFISSTLLAFGFWIAEPLLKLWKIGAGISYENAALIIGRHFGSIEDKLLNTLQLQQTATDTTSELLLASIDQRTAALKPVSFATAIDLGQNKKFLRYTLPPLFVLLLLLVFSPSFVTESTKRIVSHRTPFENLAPFLFSIQNNDLSTVELQDFEMSVSLDGKEVPNDLYIEFDGKRTLMNRSSASSFSFVFRQPRESVDFKFSGGGYYSSEYTLKVLPKPNVVDFTVTLDYPNYLKRKTETRQNNGDLLIPTGTKVAWTFNTLQTDDVHLFVSDSLYPLNRTSENSFSFSQRFLNSTDYTILGSNQYIKNGDSLRYTVTVIPDLYPSILVSGVEDSLNPKHMYFNGLVKDDHGFSSLIFKYRKLNANTSDTELNDVVLHVNPVQTTEEFYHFWNLTPLGLEPGDVLEYYFEVWDNDGVNGSKSTRSEKKTYRVATLDELASENDSRSQKLKEELSESLKMAEKMKKNLGDLQKDLLDKPNLSWEDKNKMKELLEMQKELQKKVENIQQESEEKNSKMNEMMEFDPQLVEKQQQLEKLFEDVMSDEMKKLFDEMERLMEEMTKDKAQELLEDMEFSNEDLEKELDRSLELFKQLEFEMKMEQTMERLEELAEKQEQLSDETKEKSAENEELSAKQEKLNEEFDDIKKDIDDLEKKNEELEDQNDMEDFSNEEESISENQEESKEQLEQNKNKKASDSQKKASEQMKNMAQKMGSMMMKMQAQGQEEDLEALRQIVENLLTLSFDEEALIDNLKKTNHNDPKYTDLAREQLKLKDDSKLIEDSLYALSKRVPQIETIINREIRSIKSNMKKSIQKMADRKTPDALSRQQFALTSLNNLALLLSETIQQMQQAMASQMSGSGSCSKPGKGNSPSAASMRKLQEQLNKQLEQMKKGQKPGGKEKGPQKGGMSPGGKGMSKQLAKMAAQQEALRNMAREYESKMKKEEGGKGSGGDMKKLRDMMEETETDLVNKLLTRETLLRQQEILTKLLEAEKAELEREQEQRRESREAKSEDYGNPEIFFEYIRRKNNETELLRTIPPNLNPFYREKVDEYFKKQTE